MQLVLAENSIKGSGEFLAFQDKQHCSESKQCKNLLSNDCLLAVKIRELGSLWSKLQSLCRSFCKLISIKFCLIGINSEL